MTLRFVHAADLHLDSPFKGIRETEARVADVLRHATFEAYERVIDLCIDRRVDALLVAGDVFDGSDRSLAAQVQFVRGLERLHKAGIRAFICHGNHDPLDGWGARLKMPPNVHQFGERAESVSVDPQSSTSPVVCGISYPTREIRTSLLPGFPVSEPGRVTIGMLHANVGSSTGHEAYAPCTVEELAVTGYAYWALGHVHTRAILRDASPMVVYPGNTQGRHPNERGPRGVYLVEIDDQGAHVTISPEFVAVDSVRWEQVDVQIDGIEDDGALFGRLEALIDDLVTQADDRHLVYRVVLKGRGPVHESLARAAQPGVGQPPTVCVLRRNPRRVEVPARPGGARREQGLHRRLPVAERCGVGGRGAGCRAAAGAGTTLRQRAGPQISRQQLAGDRRHA